MKSGLSVLSVFFILAYASVSHSETTEELRSRADLYWTQIQKIAATEFGGFNLEITVHTSYNFEETTNSGKGVGVGLSMPIYSKKDKLDVRSKVREYLEHGSQLLKEFRVSIDSRNITNNECNLYKTLMPEQGIDAAKALFDCQRRYADLVLTVEQKERDIKSLIDPYLKNK